MRKTKLTARDRALIAQLRWCRCGAPYMDGDAHELMYGHQPAEREGQGET